MAERMKDNNIYFVAQDTTSTGQMGIYFYGKTERKDDLVFVEITLNSNGGASLQGKSKKEFLVPLFLQSLAFLLMQNV